MNDNADSVKLTTTRRRFLAACAAAGAAAFIPGIGLLDKTGKLDEAITTPPSGFTCEWQIQPEGETTWTTIGYGETLVLPDLGVGLYQVRTLVTAQNTGVLPITPIKRDGYPTITIKPADPA